MPPEQIFIGCATALLCVAGFVQRGWLLEHTRKGRWLVEKLGLFRATWVLATLLAFGAVFGVLLATGVVNPVQW